MQLSLVFTSATPILSQKFILFSFCKDQPLVSPPQISKQLGRRLQALTSQAHQNLYDESCHIIVLESFLKWPSNKDGQQLLAEIATAQSQWLSPSHLPSVLSERFCMIQLARKREACGSIRTGELRSHRIKLVFFVMEGKVTEPSITTHILMKHHVLGHFRYLSSTTTSPT